MNIVIIGTGYVGLVTGVGLASLGNNVTFIDLDEDKINKLNNKNLPFYEPGLEKYFDDNDTFARMQFVSKYLDVNWEDKEIVFICVQTPNNLETNSVDTKFLESAINEVNNLDNRDLIITIKSTIPPYEIEKICIWSGCGNTIKNQDLKQFSGWSRETQRWEFLLALGYQNLKDAIFLGKTIITQNENLISLSYPLTCLFQEMLFIKMNRGTFHLNRGYMPISPSVKKRIPEFSKMYSKEKIISALNYLRDIDKRQKTAHISDETELLHFILHVIG